MFNVGAGGGIRINLGKPTQQFHPQRQQQTIKIVNKSERIVDNKKIETIVEQINGKTTTFYYITDLKTGKKTALKKG